MISLIIYSPKSRNQPKRGFEHWWFGSWMVLKPEHWGMDGYGWFETCGHITYVQWVYLWLFMHTKICKVPSGKRLTTHFQHQKSTHFQHRLTPNTKNSLPTPKINSLPTQKALFGVEGESTFRFPIGTEASLLEPHHKQTLQGKWSTLRNPARGFNPLGWGGEPSGYHTGGMINTDKPI